MRSAASIVVLAALALSTPAFAASRIVTPSLLPSTAGSLSCLVTNASETKPLEVTIEFRSSTGEVVYTITGPIAAGGSDGATTGLDAARFCVVRVLSGGKKNAIVSLVAIDGGIPVAAVQPNR